MNRNLNIIPEPIKNLINEIGIEMHNIFGSALKEIILYGSYARNEQDGDSDIDIMVLVDADEQLIELNKNIVLEAVIGISLKYGIVISIIEKSYNKFREYTEYVPFYKNIERDGIAIYG